MPTTDTTWATLGGRYATTSRRAAQAHPEIAEEHSRRISNAYLQDMARRIGGDASQRRYAENINSIQRAAQFLILRIAMIDIEAAMYLLHLYDERQREDAVNSSLYRYGNNVDETFTWSQTPQGANYWSKINTLDSKLRNDLNNIIAGRDERNAQCTIV